MVQQHWQMHDTQLRMNQSSSAYMMIIITFSVQMAEAALADEWVINGDRVALQRRVLRLGKPPRRWKRPSWAADAMREPLEVVKTCCAHPCRLSLLTIFWYHFALLIGTLFYL